MNRKQLFLLLAALVIIGGACLVLLQRHQQSWTVAQDQIGHKLLKDFQLNDVAAIHIKGDTDLVLARKDDGWHVQERGNYPANLSQIKDLLIKMADLKVAQTDPIAASQLKRMQLEQPGKGAGSAVLLEFKNAQGQTMQSILLGKKHTRQSMRPSPMPYGEEGFPDGRYLMLAGDPKTVLTVSDPLNSAEPQCAEWLDKDFFKVEKPRMISFVSTNATNSWTLTRASESASWTLEQPKAGEVLDTNKVSSLASTLSYPSFVDVAADAAPDKTGLDKPLTVTIETFDHFTYTLKIGQKTPENDYHITVAVAGDIPAARTPEKDEKPADKAKLDKEFQDKTKPLQEKLNKEKALGKWTYLVNSWLVDPVIRDRAQLMVEKKTEKTDESAAPEAKPASAPEEPDDTPDVMPDVEPPLPD
jgi:hypothetical protein